MDRSVGQWSIPPGPKGVEAQRGLVTRTVNGLIDNWIHNDAAVGSVGAEIEFVSAFAVPLPVIVITSMLGFSLGDIPQLKAWSEAWVLPFAGNLAPT